jgi:hypothetical protein
MIRPAASVRPSTARPQSRAAPPMASKAGPRGRQLMVTAVTSLPRGRPPIPASSAAVPPAAFRVILPLRPATYGGQRRLRQCQRRRHRFRRPGYGDQQHGRLQLRRLLHHVRHRDRSGRRQGSGQRGRFRLRRLRLHLQHERRSGRRLRSGFRRHGGHLRRQRHFGLFGRLWRLLHRYQLRRRPLCFLHLRLRRYLRHRQRRHRDHDANFQTRGHGQQYVWYRRIIQ